MRKKLKPENLFWTKPHSFSPTALRKLQNEVFSNQNLQASQRLITLLGSETRLQIMFLLSLQKTLCVGDIADTLRLDISAISHQLRILKKEKLVRGQRKKKVVYYSLERNLPALVGGLLSNNG